MGLTRTAFLLSLPQKVLATMLRYIFLPMNFCENDRFYMDDEN
jgi:hypothetical protein